MGVLRERALDSAIVDAIRGGIPVLGICVGCQVVFDRTEEHDARCLGLVPGTARAFPASGQLKVPHMGWNTIEFEQGHWLFRGIAQNASFSRGMFCTGGIHPAIEVCEHAVRTIFYGFRS